MRTVAALALGLLLAMPGLSTPHPSRRHTVRKSAAASKKSRVRSKYAGQTWRRGQMQPTPDRYKEIQTALAAQGFSEDPPDGVWSPRWTDSLKRFQQARKLEPSGKLTSLSLITLGLGPKRQNSTLPVLSPAATNGSTESTLRVLQ